MSKFGPKRQSVVPSPDELEQFHATMGYTEPLSMALLEANEEYELDMRKYQQSQQQRFRPGSLAGISESLYDMFRGRKTFKDMQESRAKVQQEGIKYTNEQVQKAQAKELELQDERYNRAKKILAYVDPTMLGNPDALEATAREFAVSDADFKKLYDIGKGEADMKLGKEIDPATGRTYEFPIGPDGAQIPGTDRRLVGLPPEQEKKQQSPKPIDITKMDGSQVRLFLDPETYKPVHSVTTTPAGYITPEQRRKQADDIQASEDVAFQIQDYIAELEVRGYEPNTWGNMEEAGIMKGKYALVRNNLRQLYDLGVLQKADLELLEESVGDPNNFNWFGTNAMKDIEFLRTHMDKVQREIAYKRDALAPPPQPAGGGGTVLNYDVETGEFK
jgi:hypothetical protein